MNDPRTATAAGASTPAELDAIEAALGDLAISALEDNDEIIEDAAPDLGESGVVMDENETMELASVLARVESYEESTAGTGIETDSTVIETTPPETAAPDPVKATKAPRAKTSSPRAARDVASLSPENFVLTMLIPADLEANKADVIASRPTQKKVAEKFDNVLLSVAAGKRPSTYTMDCFAILSDRKTATQGDLVKALMSLSRKDGSKTYSEGTARSQAGQIMSLFSVLKIASRSGQTLTLNGDSTLAAALAGMMTAPAAGAAATT